MSKKHRRKQIVKPRIERKQKNTKHVPKLSRDFAVEIEKIARQVAAQMIYPFENEMRRIQAEVDNIKANMVSAITCLENNSLLREKDYLKVYESYIATKVGIIEDGKMDGRPIFNLYNMEG